MHHDNRLYIEVRYDGNTADCVIVNFRDRGILPIEATTWEYSFNSTALINDTNEELRSVINQLWLAIYHDK